MAALLVAALTGCRATYSPQQHSLVLVGDLWLPGATAPSPGALAIDGGRIVGVVPPDTSAARVLRADAITAGLIDAHAHIEGVGARAVTLDLAGLPSYAATLDAIAVAAKTSGPINGRGWDQNRWPDVPAGGWPLAADLERVAPGRAVVLRRIDGHASWVSPTVLNEARIDASTVDPPGGRILRDARGAPSGVLVDEAIGLLPPQSVARDVRAAHLEAGLAALARVGLVGVHDMGVDDVGLGVLDELARADRLPVRVWAYAMPGTEAERRLLTSGPYQQGRLSVVGVKRFADGALGSRGAHLRDDYADEPGHHGLPGDRVDTLGASATGLLATGAQLAVHAIGDAAVHETLTAFAAARAAHPDREAVPLRVEHAQIVSPRDWLRFRAVGAIASMQPTHATSDLPWATARLGPERTSWAYAWRTARDSGVPLALGSDAPVEQHDPALGLWAATRRQALDGTPAGGWSPEQQLTLGHALHGFTEGTYAALGQRGGRLSPGADADVTLWRTADDAPWVALATIVAGELVYLHPDLADTSP